MYDDPWQVSSRLAFAADANCQSKAILRPLQRDYCEPQKRKSLRYVFLAQECERPALHIDPRVIAFSFFASTGAIAWQIERLSSRQNAGRNL
jgi:hypothetical protein